MTTERICVIINVLELIPYEFGFKFKTLTSLTSFVPLIRKRLKHSYLTMNVIRVMIEILRKGIIIMAKQKLPHATDWEARHIDDWTVTTFRSYITHLHEQRFGIPYAPFRNWGAESKMMKTASDDYGKEVTRRFIEQEIKDYTPTYAYPGTSFGFLYSYRKNELQRIKLEYDKELKRATISTTTNADEWEW